MHIHEALAIAGRLQSIARRADTFGPKTREDILEEILAMAKDFELYADRLDQEMEREYLNSMADHDEYVRG